MHQTPVCVRVSVTGREGGKEGEMASAPYIGAFETAITQIEVAMDAVDSDLHVVKVTTFDYVVQIVEALEHET